MTDSPPPLAPGAKVDLHLHTLASDGAWTPAALVDHLASNEFSVVAVCDHDTQRSVAEVTRRAAKRGIAVIPGVEVTSRWGGRQLHVLVYGVAPDRADEAARPFRSLLADLDASLMYAAEDARRRVEGAGRALPSLEEVTAGRPIWPYHVLIAMIREGHARGLKDAAELVAELGGTFTADEPLERVVEAAHAAGGVAVIAHPGRADAVGILSEEDLDRIIAEGIAVDGIEAHYRSYTDDQTAHYRAVAAGRGLLVSCGSDSHAPRQPVDPRPWRAAWCADLLGRLGIAVSAPDGPAWERGMDSNAAPRPRPEPKAEPELEPGSAAAVEIGADGLPVVRDEISGQPESIGEQIMEAEAELEARGRA
ncbi:MAG: PHP domain-containing protein [Chloroflexota bacterium]